ncbi:hypothetical protein [Agromyces bauzanensis]
MEAVPFLVMFVLGGIAATVFGAYASRWPEEPTRVVKGLGTSMFGAKVADRIYTKEGVRAGAIGFLILGPLFTVVGLIIIVLVLIKG